jgi:hypothetical protein
MVDITVFELHLDGSEFTANAPWSGEEPEAESEVDTDESGGPPLALLAVAAVVALLGVVGLAVAAKKLRGGDDTDLEEIADDIA